MFRIISKSRSKRFDFSILNNSGVELEICIYSFLSDSKKGKSGEKKPKKEKNSEDRVKKILDEFLYKKKPSNT